MCVCVCVFAGFVVIRLTSGLIHSFQFYKAGSLVNRVNHHGNLC